MNKSHLLGGGLTLLASLLLAACNNNDDDNAATPTVVQTTQVTVTPSLGKILNAKVTLKNAKTGATLGTGNTGNTGIATFNATQTSDPVIAEVQGQAGSKYFDESKKAELDFAATQTLRVVLPTITNNIGVSTLTEVAYQAAVKKAGSASAITSEIATATNEAIRKALAPELASITTAATLVGSTADLSILANTEAGKYALKLAALAELAKTQTAPALAILNQLAADITTDDKLDGIAAGKEITFTYNNSNLVSQITTNINGIITTANLSGVGFNVNAFNPVVGAITINVGGTGGGTGSGQACLANVNYTVTGVPVIGTVNGTHKICYNNFPTNAICGAANQQLQGLVSAANIPTGTGVGSVSYQYSYTAVSSCANSGANVTVNYVN